MTRPKDLTLESPPVDSDSIPVDSAGGGTRRVLVGDLMLYGSQRQYAEDEGAPSDSTSATLATVLSLVTPSLPAGTYRVEWFAESYSDTVATADPRVRIDIDGTATGADGTHLSDITVNATLTGTGGPDGIVSGWRELALSAAVHTIRMKLARFGGAGTASLVSRRLSIIRVG